MKKYWTIKANVLIHGLIMALFAAYCVFLAEPAFKPFEVPVPGIARLQDITVPPLIPNVLYDVSGENTYIGGWAFIYGEDAEDQKMYLLLSGKSDYIFDVIPYPRPYVTRKFHNLGKKLDDSGFYVNIPGSVLPEGNYALGVIIEKGNIRALHYTDRFISKHNGHHDLVPALSSPQDIQLPADSNAIIFEFNPTIQMINQEDSCVEVSGTAFINLKDTMYNLDFIVLQSEARTYVFNAFQDQYRAGFVARIPRNIVDKGLYRLGIYIKNGTTERLRYTDDYIQF